jgi:putative addiction module component (TIGR02574 family)
MSIQEIEAYALQLPPSERARLAQRLIDSLDDEGEVEQAWTEEAIRRDDELRSGQETAVPADQVFADARAASK